MHLSRLLLLSLMIPACVLPASAQSTSTPAIGAPVPLFGGLTPPPDFRTRIPGIGTHALGNAHAPQQPLFNLNALSGLHFATGPSLQGETTGSIPVTHVDLAAKVLAPAPQQKCYSLRSYHFERDSPDSDALSFKDYSTCQSSSQLKAKNAVSARVVLVR